MAVVYSDVGVEVSGVEKGTNNAVFPPPPFSSRRLFFSIKFGPHFYIKFTIMAMRVKK